MANYPIREYGYIRRASDYSISGKEKVDLADNSVYLINEHFESLQRFVKDNQDPKAEKDPPFILLRKNSKDQIRVLNYVGVIETRDGTTIEVLPKIYLTSNGERAVKQTKKVFLRMLKHLRNTPFRTLGTAHIASLENYPILEVFISEFVRELGYLMQNGLKHDYISYEDNLKFKKSKLLISENIMRNPLRKDRFFCRYDDFEEDIPQNRILKAAALKLFDTTRINVVRERLGYFISLMDGIGIPDDINVDLRKCSNSGRLFHRYSELMKWAEVFLTGRAFINFRGSSLNKALLFPMERVFEDYVTFLFRKLIGSMTLFSQKRIGYLIIDHENSSMFGLRPDMYAERENNYFADIVVIDAKWKVLDATAKSRNYDLKMTDMYQLYAYGKKFEGLKHSPVMVMVYPANENFKGQLSPFIYEKNENVLGKLELIIYALDLNNPEADANRIISDIVLRANDKSNA